MFLRIVGLRGGGRVPNLAGCVAQMSNHGTGNMMTIRTLIVIICITCLASLALAQGAPTPAPVPVAPADAKNHVGTLAIVCGKAVDAQIGDPGMSGYGKPVTFDIDEPPEKPLVERIFDGEHHRRETQLEIDRRDQLAIATDIENLGRLIEIRAQRLLNENA